MIVFREATLEDVAAIITLASDDVLGRTREGADPDVYREQMACILSEPHNHVIVGEDATGAVVATYQITFISGLSLGAARRAQIETVRVATHLRGQGVGRAMFADAEARARAEGCALMQLTMNASRDDARRFYGRLGFDATHTGFKKPL